MSLQKHNKNHTISVRYLEGNLSVAPDGTLLYNQEEVVGFYYPPGRALRFWNNWVLGRWHTEVIGWITQQR